MISRSQTPTLVDNVLVLYDDTFMREFCCTEWQEDGDAAAAEFSTQNIHEILEHRTQKRLIGGYVLKFILSMLSMLCQGKSGEG